MYVSASRSPSKGYPGRLESLARLVALRGRSEFANPDGCTGTGPDRRPLASSPAAAETPVQTDARATNNTAQVIIAGHAFMQNLRRGHYELTVDLPVHDRVRAAFDQLALCL